MERLREYDAWPLPVEDIFFDVTFNCRASITSESVRQLADSIKSDGLEYPITVQPYGAPGKYRIVAGHRRYRAVTLILGWKTVPAMVRDGLSDEKAKKLNFVENLERKTLNILEEAIALRDMYADDTPIRRIAGDLSKPYRWVQIRRRLLQLPEQIQSAAASGQLSAINIEALAQIDTPAAQISACKRLIREKKRGRRHVTVRRKFVRPRTKQEVSDKVAQLLDLGLEPMARVGAWCAGYISDKDLQETIAACLKNKQRRNN